MNVAGSEFLSSIANLASGKTVVLDDVSWEEFEGILLEMEDSPGYRITYDGGRMEVVSPSGKHKRLKTIVGDTVVILSDEMDQEVLGYGSVTLKLKPKRKG